MREIRDQLDLRPTSENGLDRTYYEYCDKGHFMSMASAEILKIVEAKLKRAVKN